MRYEVHNGTVLCENTVPCKTDITENGMTYQREDLPRYRIIGISEKEDFWKTGDIIICNSTGTLLNNHGDKKYIFKTENIVGRIKE